MIVPDLADQAVLNAAPGVPLRDVADAGLNRLAYAQHSLPRPDAQRLTLQAALLGQHGLRLQDTARNHRLDGLPNPLTALEVAFLIHAGLPMAVPGTDEFGVAVGGGVRGGDVRFTEREESMGAEVGSHRFGGSRDQRR